MYRNHFWNPRNYLGSPYAEYIVDLSAPHEYVIEEWVYWLDDFAGQEDLSNKRPQWWSDGNTNAKRNSVNGFVKLTYVEVKALLEHGFQISD